MDLLFLFRRVSYYQYQIKKKKKYNARYNVEKKGKTVCKQLFSIIIILHKISKQKKLKQKQIYLLSLKFLFHIADHYIM